MKTKLLTICLLCSSLCFGRAFYFSSSIGDDDRSSAEAQNPETPWRSLSKFNSFIPYMQPGDTAFFRRGDTFQGGIAINRSGTSREPIVMIPYGSGPKPIFTQAVTLKAWKDLGNGIWVSTNESLDSEVNNVLINDVPQEKGRWPNSNAANNGYLTIDAFNTNVSLTDAALSSSPNWTGAEVVIRKQRWKIDRSPITSHVGTTIYYNSATDDKGRVNIGYFIQNHIKTLDLFGEWYYDRDTRKLYVYFGEQNPNDYVVEASSGGNVITVKNSSYFVINKFVLKGANYDGIRISGGNNMSILNTEVLSAGRYGIDVNDHENIRIETCEVSYANEGGIQINGDYAKLRKSRITNTGIFPGMGLPIGNGLSALYISSFKGLVEYNTIKNTGYVGIQFKQDSLNIQYNLIDNFCLVVDDGGGIYSHNSSNNEYFGRRLYRNIVINGIGNPAGTRSTASSAQGIFLDDNANGVDIIENTVANIADRGIYVHNGRRLNIIGNTVYNNLTQFFTRHSGLGDAIRKCNIVGNIFFSRVSAQYVAQHYSILTDVGQIGRFDSNYYCRPLNRKNIIKTYMNANGYYTLPTWESTFGQDQNSGIDPIQLSDTNDIRFEYNPTSSSKTVSLDGDWVDAKNKTYSGSVKIKAYSSVVLMKKLPSYLTTATAAAVPTALSATEMETTNTAAVTVFPNPFRDVINLQLAKLEKGTYMLNLYTPAGSLLLSKRIEHTGFSSNQTIQVGSSVPSGNYFLQLVGPDGKNYSYQLHKD